jgi:hypothetical protein
MMMVVGDRRDAAHVRQNGDSTRDLVDQTLFCLIFIFGFVRVIVKMDFL